MDWKNIEIIKADIYASQYSNYCGAVKNQTINNLTKHGFKFFSKDLLIAYYDKILDEEYSIDHVFPKSIGFRYYIPASVISNLNNIALIRKVDNELKGNDNSIKIKELFSDYSRFKKQAGITKDDGLGNFVKNFHTKEPKIRISYQNINQVKIKIKLKDEDPTEELFFNELFKEIL